ncbi:hypothetical protein AB0A96_39235, partial [Streptomyces asiaticus]|uniref:hypothetical protein n=1 Tax=Streptomyces asiaticus TaxID=114695 RepID=UPI0033CF9616
ELRYGRLQELTAKLAAEEEQLAARQGAHRLLPGDVQEGTTVKVDGRHGELVVTYERHPEIVGLGKAA